MQLLRVRERGSEGGKDGNKCTMIVITLTTDSQAPKDKVGGSADTCAQIFKTAPNVCTLFPKGLSQRKGRGNVPSGFFLCFLLLCWPLGHLLGKSNPKLHGRLPHVGRA